MDGSNRTAARANSLVSRSAVFKGRKIMDTLNNRETLADGLQMKETADVQGMEAQPGRLHFTIEDIILVQLADC